MINVDFESLYDFSLIRVRVPDTTTVAALLQVINPGAPFPQFMSRNEDKEHIIMCHTQIRDLGLEQRVLHWEFGGSRNGQRIFYRWSARRRLPHEPTDVLCITTLWIDPLLHKTWTIRRIPRVSWKESVLCAVIFVVIIMCMECYYLGIDATVYIYLEWPLHPLIIPCFIIVFAHQLLCTTMHLLLDYCDPRL